MSNEERTLTPNEEASITEGSKYLTTAKGYKSKFDMAEILVEGKMPEFENAADKMTCSIELGQFVKRSGWGLGLENLISFLKIVDLPHRVMLFKQLDHPFSMMEVMERDATNPDFINMLGDIMEYMYGTPPARI